MASCAAPERYFAEPVLPPCKNAQIRKMGPALRINTVEMRIDKCAPESY